jgi:hypothetical protein
MIPGKYNFICPQGSTFSKSLTWTIDNSPVNLQNYSARMQVRETYFAQDTIVSLTSPDEGITLGGTAGTISIYIDSDVTTEFPPGTFVYDLEVVSGASTVTRLIEGSFIVSPEVTR